MCPTILRAESSENQRVLFFENPRVTAIEEERRAARHRILGGGHSYLELGTVRRECTLPLGKQGSTMPLWQQGSTMGG